MRPCYARHRSLTSELALDGNRHHNRQRCQSASDGRQFTADRLGATGDGATETPAGPGAAPCRSLAGTQTCSSQPRHPHRHMVPPDGAEHAWPDKMMPGVSPARPSRPTAFARLPESEPWPCCVLSPPLRLIWRGRYEPRPEVDPVFDVALPERVPAVIVIRALTGAGSALSTCSAGVAGIRLSRQMVPLRTLVKRAPLWSVQHGDHTYQIGA
jgi:hypothetical protein